MVLQSGSTNTARNDSSQEYMNTMHPHIFRDTWQLTNWQTALLLGLSERSIIAYCASANSTSRRNPSLAVQRLTFIQHQTMLNEGKN